MNELFNSDLFGSKVTHRELETKAIITPKRRVILEALRNRETLTLAEAVDLIGGDVYANKNFHVGNVLSGMVKQGLIRRVKPGVFTNA